MANKEYIERQSFLKKIERYSLSNGTTLGKHSGVADEIIDVLTAEPAADVVEQSVFKMMLENAMAIPKPMHLYIYFADEHVEKHMVTRFTDLSQTKSQFYYYEEPHHESGKGKTFRRDEIKCFEVSFCPLQNWEQHLAVEK
jgi:hypothetical protein